MCLSQVERAVDPDRGVPPCPLVFGDRGECFCNVFSSVFFFSSIRNCENAGLNMSSTGLLHRTCTCTRHRDSCHRPNEAVLVHIVKERTHSSELALSFDFSGVLASYFKSRQCWIFCENIFASTTSSWIYQKIANWMSNVVSSVQQIAAGIASTLRNMCVSWFFTWYRFDLTTWQCRSVDKICLQ